MNFKEFTNQSVVSFDFDGVMHIDVIPGTHHPINMHDLNPTPHLEMHEKVRNEAKKHRVVIVTKRNEEDTDPVRHLIKRYDLPIKEVHATNNTHKLGTLLQLGVIRHYDDDGKMKDVLEEHNIEFIHVPPK